MKKPELKIRRPLAEIERVLAALDEFDDEPFSAEIQKHLARADDHLQEVAAILEQSGL